MQITFMVKFSICTEFVVFSQNNVFVIIIQQSAKSLMIQVFFYGFYWYLQNKTMIWFCFLMTSKFKFKIYILWVMFWKLEVIRKRKCLENKYFEKFPFDLWTVFWRYRDPRIFRTCPVNHWDWRCDGLGILYSEFVKFSTLNDLFKCLILVFLKIFYK